MRQVKILMPRMGTSVHEGTVVQWLKEEGDVLEKGDPLLLAESEKVEFEMESPYSGRLVKILTPVQSAIPVGETMALVETEDEVSVEEETESDPDPAGAPGPADGEAPPLPPPRSGARESRFSLPGFGGWRGSVELPWRRRRRSPGPAGTVE